MAYSKKMNDPAMIKRVRLQLTIILSIVVIAIVFINHDWIIKTIKNLIN